MIVGDMPEKTYGGQCGECSKCGKCQKVLNRSHHASTSLHTGSCGASTDMSNIADATPRHGVAKVQPNRNNPVMEQDTSEKLYTFLIYSENVPGLLSQISSVFTRRQVNIESLNVCASSTPGAHKYTVTAFCDEYTAQMLTAQMEKRIEVLQANYYTDDEIFINETALLKISTPTLLNNPDVSHKVRLYGARIVEVNSTYAVVEKNGMPQDIVHFYDELKEFDCVLQFVRTGRICITKSRTEHLDEYLAVREAKRISSADK